MGIKPILFEVNRMGVIKRVKQAVGGVGETIEDIRRMGAAGSVIKRVGVFSERNANAVKTIGEDTGIMRR